MNKHVDVVSSRLYITPVSSIPLTAKNGCHVTFKPSTIDLDYAGNNRDSNNVYSSTASTQPCFESRPKSSLHASNNAVLYNIIAKDVTHPNNKQLTETSIHSRNTVVKKSADGAVQITYKNMVSTAPIKTSTPVFILPKLQSNQHSVNCIEESKRSRPLQNGFHTPKDSILSNHVEFKYENISQPHMQSTGNNLSIRLPKMTSKEHSLYKKNTSSDQFPASRQNCMNMLDINGEVTHSDAITTLPVTAQLTTGDNTFSGIDIDFSCLNTETFDVSQDFFLPSSSNLQSNVDDIDVSSFLSSSSSGETGNKQVTELAQCNHVQQHQVCDASVGQYTLTSENYMNNFCQCSGSQQTDHNSLNCTLLKITDVSPEFASSSGGTKIILIGSWNAKNARYQCRFGSDIVNAELIQSGVLRCYSPIHKPGPVKLSVLCNDIVISEETSFMFLYQTKDKNNEKLHDKWLSITNNSLVHLLVERISFITEIIGQIDCAVMNSHILNLREEEIENMLLDVCKRLMTMSIDIQFEYNIENTMTILHLCAALGYIKLIQLLMNWVETNPTKVILAEANPRCIDQFHLLPIMWSSAKGHFNTTCVLHQWAEDTLAWKDQCGCSSLNLATECGHGSLVDYLGRLLRKSATARYILFIIS